MSQFAQLQDKASTMRQDMALKIQNEKERVASLQKELAVATKNSAALNSELKVSPLARPPAFPPRSLAFPRLSWPLSPAG
jgi:hypothetical protein